MQPPSEGEAPVIEQSVVVWDVETTELIQRGVVEIEDMQISVACARILTIENNVNNSQTRICTPFGTTPSKRRTPSPTWQTCSSGAGGT